MTQGFEITPRKRPTQARAQATFDALVEACARLLPDLGYVNLTTNAIAERAGVGIGSLYEYFPGKDAIIALVVERLVERVMARLDDELDVVLSTPSADGVERWIARLHATLESERALVAVLVQQVPYTRQLECLRNLPATLLAFSERARVRAGLDMQRPAASLSLINNLVSSTLMQVVFDAPPDGVSKTELLGTLSAHVSELIAVSSTAPEPD